MVKLSIIIVNYNGIKYLDDCLNSIINICKNISYEIIFVDNASNDNSLKYISENYPQVIAIENKENLGFAAGNNIGVANSSGEYILLLNNDTILLSELTSALGLLEFIPTIGVVGIKMLGKNHEYRMSTGHFVSPLRLFKISSLHKKDGKFYNGDFPNSNDMYYKVDWVEGSFLLTRRKIWEKLGGLDEEYFMYVEDMDFCKNVKNIGYECVYFPNVSYIHYGGYSTNRLDMLVFGFRRFLKKHNGVVANIMATIILTFKLTFKYIISRVKGIIEPAIKYKSKIYLKILFDIYK